MKNLSDTKLGILGGGQLGKMLCIEASNWHVNTSVLDPSAHCPSSTVCSSFTLGNFNSYDDVYNFGKNLDVLTIEIEHVDTHALVTLEEGGLTVRPGADILRIIKDKGEQKRFYSSMGLPTSRFSVFDNKDELTARINDGKIELPFVQKSRQMGYDGKGVKIVTSNSDLESLLPGPCIVEDLVDLQKEISVIAVRNSEGEVKCFPSVEMVFNPDANLVEYLISPSDIAPRLSRRAEELAVETINSFGLCGILAVEMFLDNDDNILINEVAPRPHNSGHHTIESCITSQYEQYLRSLLDLPLAEPELIMPSVMVNILGEPGYEGEAKYDGLRECLSVTGAKIHIYGKKITRPYRKMGHVTIIDRDIKNALKKADIIKNKLRVVS